MELGLLYGICFGMIEELLLLPVVISDEEEKVLACRAHNQNLQTTPDGAHSKESLDRRSPTLLHRKPLPMDVHGKLGVRSDSLDHNSITAEADRSFVTVG